ncbi:MAG: Zn-dependent dipeptidase, microsomal dipeptidase [Isosphaeraceae bacterium]|nr:Zn-dependent dipeptidase, microsomal dipeptidase [Isosphaeraceae bacterium]
MMNRLFDFRCNWLAQYAREITLFDPELQPDPSDRLARLEGYLQTTSAFVVPCGPPRAEWERVADPWRMLSELATRVEAEFSGRTLHGPADLERFRDDPHGLAWAVLAIDGLDALVREAADVERAASYVGRGVRVIRLVSRPGSSVAGGDGEGDERGLLDLGRSLLDRLAAVGPEANGVRPSIDLTGLNAQARAEVLDWFEAEPARAEALIPVGRAGAASLEGGEQAGRLALEDLRRIRSLGGWVGIEVGPPQTGGPEEFARAIEVASNPPRLGRPGPEGLLVSSCFLDESRFTQLLGDAPAILDWLRANLDRSSSRAVGWENGIEWLEAMIGAGTERG